MFSIDYTLCRGFMLGIWYDGRTPRYGYSWSIFLGFIVLMIETGTDGS